jgi:glycosyltransferase involved in cell wall biosynthesis
VSARVRRLRQGALLGRRALGAGRARLPAPAISVVVPVHNEEDNVGPLVERTVRVLDAHGEPFEIVYVDDGSRDRTFERLVELSHGEPRLRIVRLARGFGQEQAVQAGYLHARGDWILQMDGDQQHPPEEMPKLLAARAGDVDVVYGVRRHRHDRLHRVLASRFLLWSMKNVFSIRLPEDVSTFRLMRRELAQRVASLPEHTKFLSALFVWSGARIASVDVEHAPRAKGETKYDLGKLVRHTLDLVVGFSSRPLELLGWVGALFAALGLSVGVWAVVRRLVWGYGLAGWSSLFAAVAVLSGVQLLALAVMGQYVARIFAEVQGRPLFRVREVVGGPAQRPRARAKPAPAAQQAPPAAQASEVSP